MIDLRGKCERAWQSWMDARTACALGAKRVGERLPGAVQSLARAESERQARQTVYEDALLALIESDEIAAQPA